MKSHYNIHLNAVMIKYLLYNESLFQKENADKLGLDQSQLLFLIHFFSIYPESVYLSKSPAL